MAPRFYIAFSVAVQENRRAWRAAGRTLFGFSLDPHPAAKCRAPHSSLAEYAPGPFPPRSPPWLRRMLRALKDMSGLLFGILTRHAARTANEPRSA
jgi:hypothetical protein